MRAQEDTFSRKFEVSAVNLVPYKKECIPTKAGYKLDKLSDWRLEFSVARNKVQSKVTIFKKLKVKILKHAFRKWNKLASHGVA